MSLFFSMLGHLRARGGVGSPLSSRHLQSRLTVLPLEDRTVPSSLDVRSIDGTGNNLANPDWGSTGIQFLRVAAADYADGIFAASGVDRPSARVISNAIADQGDEQIVNRRLMSAMVYAWGQFIDHDLDLTISGGTEAMRIPVPAGDPFFDPSATGTQTINTTRSVFDPLTGISIANPRQQLNAITAWLDGSMVYGSDDAIATSLRAMQGGKLKTSDGDLLPIDADGFFLAGDVRVNENPELVSLQTLFVREHNRLADRIASANPTWTDEQIYQEARRVVIAEIQSITFNEWLPAVLGSGAVPRYSGYDPSVNPGITNEFATAGFRFGHSLLGDDIEFLDNNGLPIADEVALRDAFFNTDLIREHGIDPVLKYLASDPSSELDTKVINSVRNFLFGPPGAGGLDLASLNIQRGRDHGLADYNATRQAYGLSKITSFDQITSNPTVQAKMRDLYGSVDNIDLWVGALAEDHVRGASVGPTLRAMISDQFTRIRDGDRFWYQREFSGRSLRELENTTLADVIRRNTTTTNVQDNAFFFRVSLSGTVFEDRNRNGRRESPERGIEGRTIELVSAVDGSLVASTTTDSRGMYRFEVIDGLGLGQFYVREILPDGRLATTRDRGIIELTRGETFVRGIDFGETDGARRSPRTAGAADSTSHLPSVTAIAPPAGTARPDWLFLEFSDTDTTPRNGRRNDASSRAWLASTDRDVGAPAAVDLREDVIVAGSRR